MQTPTPPHTDHNVLALTGCGVGVIVGIILSLAFQLLLTHLAWR